MPTLKDPVFAAACTADGYKSLYKETFDPDLFERVYILKGCGVRAKSEIVGEIARECALRGAEYELFADPLDPSYLSAVIIPQLGVCVADGSEPNALEPTYPEAVETVVELKSGAARLCSKRGEIARLYAQSGEGFRACRSYLRAMREISDNLSYIITDNFDFDKMFYAIKRFLCKEFTVGGGHTVTKRLIGVYCADGEYKSGAFFGRAAKKCLVTDKYGCCAPLFLGAVLAAAEKYELEATVSYSPLDMKSVNGLYLPRLDMAFMTAEKCGERGKYHKVFNMERFADPDAARFSKQKLKFLRRCFAEMSREASAAVRSVCEANREIEELYGTKAGDVGKKLCKEIFRGLC